MELTRADQSPVQMARSWWAAWQLREGGRRPGIHQALKTCIVMADSLKTPSNSIWGPQHELAQTLRSNTHDCSVLILTGVAHLTGRARNLGAAASSSSSISWLGLKRGGRARAVVASAGDCSTPRSVSGHETKDARLQAQQLCAFISHHASSYRLPMCKSSS